MTISGSASQAGKANPHGDTSTPDDTQPTKAESGPTHGGTCPFCKESIHAEAIKCWHCRSMLFGEAVAGAYATMAGLGGTAGLRVASNPMPGVRFDPSAPPNPGPPYEYAGYMHCQYMPEFEWIVVWIEGVGYSKILVPTGKTILSCWRVR